MGRFWAATRVAALFVVTICGSPLAHACETCERVPLAPEHARRTDVPRTIGRLDVTNAVDTATTFVIETVRGWRLWSRFGVARGEVHITQQELGTHSEPETVADSFDGSDVMNAEALDFAQYIAAYDAAETHTPVRMPSFRREHKWALTYRNDAEDAISQSERFPGMNATLDDSVVVGLRFELDYGWTR